MKHIIKNINVPTPIRLVRHITELTYRNMAGIGISIILGIPTIEELSQFLHSCIDNLVDKTGTSLNKINSDIDWSSAEYKEAGKFCQNIYRNLVSNSLYQIDEELRELGKDKIQCIKDCYEIRKPEIQRAVTNECLAKMDNPVVTDFDWKLKWIVGSSTLSSLREPLMQMDLYTKHVDQDDNVHCDKINFEMNTHELSNFIQEAEKALAKF